MLPYYRAILANIIFFHSKSNGKKYSFVDVTKTFPVTDNMKHLGEGLNFEQ